MDLALPPPWEPDAWIPAFLWALEREALDGLDLLFTMERAWFDARPRVADRRKTSTRLQRWTSLPPHR
jgi:hypothetical protein